MILTNDLTQEQLDRVAEIVHEDLTDGFGDKFVFDPIWVIPYVSDAFPDDPMDFLRILIVFEGDVYDLDSFWTVGLIDRMIPKLEAADIPHFPINSFINRREWEQYARKGWEKYLARNKR